jgi:hypothetical protein
MTNDDLTKHGSHAADDRERGGIPTEIGSMIDRVVEAAARAAHGPDAHRSARRTALVESSTTGPTSGR